jgi:hypothetical protein
VRDELSTIGRHRLTIQGLAFSSAGAIAAAFPWSIDFRTGSAFGTYTYASIYTGGSAAAFTVLKTNPYNCCYYICNYAFLPVMMRFKARP